MFLSSYSHNPEETLMNKFSAAKDGKRWAVSENGKSGNRFLSVRGVTSSESAVTRATAASTHTQLIMQRVTCTPIVVCNQYSERKAVDHQEHESNSKAVNSRR